jgi:hypothetical protein
MNCKYALVFCCSIFGGFLEVAPLASATPATDAEFAQLRAEGAGNFSAEQGKQDWTKELYIKDGDSADGDKRSCTTCHGTDLTKPGKHKKTGKVIEPMAPGVNPDRYNDQKKIEKWFKRNCEWTWRRECTAQEKGDLLKFLMGADQGK